MNRTILIYFKELECALKDSNWEKMTFHYGSPDGLELKRPSCTCRIDFEAGLCDYYFGNKLQRIVNS